MFTNDDKEVERFILDTSSGAICANDTLMYATGKNSTIKFRSFTKQIKQKYLILILTISFSGTLTFWWRWS